MLAPVDRGEVTVVIDNFLDVLMARRGGRGSLPGAGLWRV